jgi:hypothetical protein
LSIFSRFLAAANNYPWLPLTNKEAERALRHWVIARHIGNGTRTAQGTLAFSNLASVIEACRKRSVSPWPYLAEVLRQRRQGFPATVLQAPAASSACPASTARHRPGAERLPSSSPNNWKPPGCPPPKAEAFAEAFRDATGGELATRAFSIDIVGPEGPDAGGQPAVWAVSADSMRFIDGPRVGLAVTGTGQAPQTRRHDRF